MTRRFLLYFRLMMVVWILIANGGCVLLMKPARYLAARSIKNDVKADA